MREPEHADVVIVGAGSAGCVLAARLSEDPDRTVLLLEEGPDHTDGARPPRVSDPDTVPSPVSDSSWTRWGEVELPGGRTLDVPRGRLVGGSGAVNGAYFVRATAEDLAAWAARAGAEWSPEQVRRAWCRSERDLDLGARDWHGADGPIPVVRAAGDGLHPVTQALLAAAAAAGHAPLPDLNAPDAAVGAGLVPRNLLDRERAGTDLTHLAPARERPNLTVHAGARVRRVVIERGRAIGVEVDAGRRAARIVRGDQVVLCAGAAILGVTELPAGQPSGATPPSASTAPPTSGRKLGQERGGAGILLALFAVTTASAIAVRRNWAKAGPCA